MVAAQGPEHLNRTAVADPQQDRGTILQPLQTAFHATLSSNAVL